MIALEMYADESFRGKESDIVLAGFVSSIDAWANFSTLWKKRLEQDNHSHFHAARFRSKHSRLFAALSIHQRAQLLDDLLALIKDHAMVGVSCTINQRDYKSMTTPEFRSRYGSAFAVATAGCFYQAARFIESTGAPCDELSVFIEDGHTHGSGAVDLLLYAKEQAKGIDLDSVPTGTMVFGKPEPMKPLGIGSVGMGSKLTMRPLQAADILAYCTFSQPDHWSAGVLDRIAKSVPVVTKEVDRTDIRNFIDAVNQDEESRAETRQMMHRMRRELGTWGIRMINVSGGMQIDTRGVHEGIEQIDLQLPIKNFPKVRFSRDKE